MDDLTYEKSKKAIRELENAIKVEKEKKEPDEVIIKILEDLIKIYKSEDSTKKYREYEYDILMKK